MEDIIQHQRFYNQALELFEIIGNIIDEHPRNAHLLIQSEVF